MCTAISDTHTCHLFGRTLDIERSYGESVVLTPRRYPFRFLHEPPAHSHPAILGIAHIASQFPLYYDAINEAGLAIAGLKFSKNAVYFPPRSKGHNVASFEVIPWMLSQCKTVSSALELLRNTTITHESFSPDLPATPLHWLIADRERAITLESTADGLQIHENPFGVLTNNPSFAYHVTHLSDFLHLGSAPVENRLCPSVPQERYSGGLSAMGLPGDFSSASRFVRAVFVKNHTCHGTSEAEEISRFFHMMDSVAQPRGCIRTETGEQLQTVYTSCANTATRTYYFTTYHCRRIRAVSMDLSNADDHSLILYPMTDREDIQRLTHEPSDQAKEPI